MINAHGARIAVTETALEIHPEPLEAALRGTSEPTVVQLDEITGAQANDGDNWDSGTVTITTIGSQSPVTVRFAPGDTHGPEQLRALVAAAQSGDDSALSSIGTDALPGFNFVALAVKTANQNWGSICQIGLVRVVDGELTERATWLCQPPAEISHFDDSNVACHGISAADVADAPSVDARIGELGEFVGDLPVVAHNAYFDASAVRYAAEASGVAAPRLPFTCTLAHTRAAELDVPDHRLPTVAEFFGVELTQHHEAEDAAACAGVMVGLARRAKHSGSVMEYVHSTGFALGSIGEHRVTPVLKDLSGGRISTQSQRVSGATEQEDGMAAEDVDKPKKQGGAAPWQSVATPDTIPDPALDADPEAPLYDQHVTLTGEFEPFDKGQLWDGIAGQGGHVGKNVTKKTTILVTGEWATMTSKEKRARELIDKGQEIEIWPAEKLLSVLGLSEEPPF